MFGSTKCSIKIGMSMGWIKKYGFGVWETCKYRDLQQIFSSNKSGIYKSTIQEWGFRIIKREQVGESRSKKHGVFTNHHWMKISWPVISCTELPLFYRLGQNITPSTWQAISSNYQPVFKHGGIFTGFGRTSREIKPCPKNVKVKLGIIIPGMYGQFSKVEWTFSRVVASFNQFAS